MKLYFVPAAVRRLLAGVTKIGWKGATLPTSQDSLTAKWPRGFSNFGF